MVSGVKEEMETEKKDRQSSEETMLQLLEQTCNQLAKQKAIANEL